VVTLEESADTSAGDEAMRRIVDVVVEQVTHGEEREEGFHERRAEREPERRIEQHGPDGAWDRGDDEPRGIGGVGVVEPVDHELQACAERSGGSEVKQISVEHVLDQGPGQQPQDREAGDGHDR